MRRGRHHRAASLGPVRRDVPETFFRLCHHCLFLNESEKEIQECKRCERKFASKEGEETDFSQLSEEQLFDKQMEDEEMVEEPAGHRKKTSLTGLDVKW